MVLTYLLIGVIFTFLIDLAIGYLNLTEDMQWDNLQRFLCILLWPFALTIFVCAFLIKYFGG
tara:strand:- start:277 stop:462 length:186 start_codon:yes stop_codon:yes gene_type:complete